MTVKYFSKDDVPVMFDPETFKICMFLGDRWIEVTDEILRDAIRFHSREISEAEALAMATRRLCSLHSVGGRAPGGCGVESASA
jgi:hypothetical protein